ncbi:DUF5825 family protein [Actinomadura rugatobispora]|uniref:DUF5825 family protein n=1 Tax=Actinomadura rugatobispora TaxID=1994 RepID=A0ABW1ABM8_9ACTN|nr:hypothetical protein GCM10010200_045980 [Actinomadura rugatobispora]
MTAIDKPLDLGGDPAATTQAVALLRDLAPTGQHVDWRGRVTGPIDLSLLHHLPPPAELEHGPGDGTDAKEAWARSHDFGSCYYRMGPGFLQVKDVRNPSSPTQTVLDDPELIDAFTTCLTPTRVRALQAAALRDLVRRRLLLLVDDLAVTLPYRLTRWPVPFFAI